MPEFERKELLLMAVTIVLGGISYIAWHVAIAAWIWPALMLYLTRNAPVKKMLLMSFVSMYFIALIATGKFAWGTIEHFIGSSMCLPGMLLFAAVIGIILMVPFVLDSLLYKRCTPSMAILLFPFLLSGWDFVMSFTPIPTTGFSLAYSQVDFLPIVQGLSVFGMFGLTFLLGLFGSAGYYALTKFPETGKFDWRTDWKPIVPVVLILVVVIGGFARLENSDSQDSVEFMCAFGPSNFEEGQEISDLSLQLTHFDSTLVKAVNAGVGTLVFAEEAFHVRQADLGTLHDHVVVSAHANNMTVLLCTQVTVDDDSFYNQATLITKDGIQWTYNKTHGVPGAESGLISGEDKVYSSILPYGKVSAVICYDLEYPSTVNCIPSDTDILFASSWDWKALGDWRTLANSYRAVENGVCLFKCNFDGLSASFDCYGRYIEKKETYPESYDETFLMTAQTPGVETFYGQYGHVINVLYLLGAVILSAIVLAPLAMERFGKGRNGE